MKRLFISLLAALAVTVSQAQQGVTQYVWFDRTGTLMPLDGMSLKADMDVSALSDGFHTLNYVAVTGDGRVSSSRSAMFVKVGSVSGAVDCYVTVDGKEAGCHEGTVAGGLIHLDLDMASLPDGLHKLTVVVASRNKGTMLKPMSTYFIKAAGITDAADCYAIVDGDEAERHECAVVDGLIHLDLDMASLPDGLHKLTVVTASSDKGIVLHPVSTYFIKMPLGGNGISAYSYWVNDDYDSMVTINLDSPQDKLDIVSLLDVKSYPLRSSSFNFHIDNGVPTIYARNDFNLLVRDNGGLMTIKSTPFDDSNVSVKLTDFVSLTSGKTQRIDRMTDGDMKWYALDAGVGDSLAFKTNISCTAELFSPSGQRLFSRSGVDVTASTGIHAPENGRYYLCLHDARWVSYATLDYELIDKYAVIFHSPDMSAKSEIVPMRFVGNGFECLKSVTLYNDEYSFSGTNLNVESYGDASCIFDLSILDDESRTFDARLVFEQDGWRSRLS